ENRDAYLPQLYLRNLLDANGVIEPAQVEVLKRLCGNLNLSPTLANVISDALQKATLATLDAPTALTALGGEEGKAKAPMLPQTVEQLVWLSAALDAGTVQRLRPFVTLLPMSAPVPTAVNLNTAPREVIAAMIPNAGLADADRLVRARQNKPFDSVAAAQAVLGPSFTLPVQGLDVKSEYFEVRGRLRLEDQVMEQRHLVRRDLSNPQNPQVTVLNQERLSGVDSGKGGW
ncbi:MAG: type II secretion system protein GspK, partial [Pseudomonadota bacterium]